MNTLEYDIRREAESAYEARERGERYDWPRRLAIIVATHPKADRDLIARQLAMTFAGVAHHYVPPRD